MSDRSKIEWTDATWNPIRGCVKISPGCKNCYAERFAERFRGVPGHPYERGFDVRLVPGKLLEPLQWAAPRMVFVNSMSDLFEESIHDQCIATIARMMHTANWHTYQVLTKRAARLHRHLCGDLRPFATSECIWWGVSVEDKQYGLPRIDYLRDSPATVRFLSVEPLLEDLGEIDLTGIHWVILGGESGPGARPMKKEWVVSVLEQCRIARVPFFFKQWGGTFKSRAGRKLDGKEYNEKPPLSSQPIPTRAQRARIAERMRPSVAEWEALRIIA